MSAKLMRDASYLLPDPGGEVVRQLLDEIDRLKAELESKDKAIKLLQGHCNALMDTEGKLAQWKKGHTAGQEAAGYYQKQADDMIRQLRKELSDENANFTEEIMNLELQLAEARAEVRQVEQSAINFHEAWQQALNDLESARNDRAEALRSCNEAWMQATGGNYPAHTAKIIEALRQEIHDLESVRAENTELRGINQSLSALLERRNRVCL